MIAIKDTSTGSFLYPVKFDKAGNLRKSSVGCGPFAKDFGTEDNAKRIVVALKAAGFKTQFEIIKR